MTEALSRLSPLKYIGVHKSYSVAVQMIEKVTAKQIIARNFEIPVSTAYRQVVLERLNTMK